MGKKSEPRQKQLRQPPTRLLAQFRVWFPVRPNLWLAGAAGIALAMIFGLAIPLKDQGPRAALPTFDAQGHRGARGLQPENSLPGFETALALGVTTLEMDLVMTRDQIVVVHHDRRLHPDRTRGPDGSWLQEPTPSLNSLTRAELAAFDIGRLRPDSRTARRFPEQQGRDGVAIPGLTEVFALAEARSGGVIRYNVEIKTSPLAPKEAPAPEDFAAAIVQALADADVGPRVTVQSFDWRALQEVQVRAPEIRTVYLTAEERWLDNLERGQVGTSPWSAGFDVDDFQGSTPRTVKAAGGAVWSPYYKRLGGDEVREAQRLGLKVVVWTVNDPEDMASLIDLGVDGIITDYPGRLRNVMAAKGMKLPKAFAKGD